MNDVAVLASLKGAELRNRLRLFGRQSRFKIVVIACFSVVFWGSLYRLFYHALDFLRSGGIASQFLLEDLVGGTFHVFFFALFIMLVFSNAIICYTSFYKSKETEFLHALPVRPGTTFLYKFGEALAFSSWAFLFLGTPLMAAYGRLFGAPWHFYAAAMLYFMAWMFVPAAIGAMIAMVVTSFLPRTRKELVIGAALVTVAVVIVIVTRILSIRSQLSGDMRLVQEVYDSTGFSRNPLLPSFWMAKGLLSHSRGGTGTAAFFFGVIAANALFLMGLAHWMSARLMLRGWYVSQGLRHNRKYGARTIVDRVFSPLLSFVGRSVRHIVIKDVKSFIRDPVQWSQFLIFFGLLAIYFLNLRTFAYQEREIFWKNLIAQMNLLATSLTLATFASRFIFPQLSLEGRRFWIIGMMPMPREDILYGKLALSFTTSLLISETLIGISSLMLRTPTELAILHAVALLGICLGVSGLAVGLGALYPNFSEDNPSKIVSGFGGTLNLVTTLAFVSLVLALQAVPCFLYFGRSFISDGAFRAWILASMGGIAVLSLVACLVPMGLGLRAVRRMEV
ncbi:MAG: hypothetical protein HYY17_16335 [Planctomycetes bacterium]|nr:hypothetical protein [Planctomycetota bacterium]